MLRFGKVRLDWLVLLVGLLGLATLVYIQFGSHRKMWIAYLSPVGSGSDIWRVPVEGGKAQALTATRGKVLDFQVFPGGDRMVYSAENEMGGSDLWVMDRDGGNLKQVLACGAGHCLGAVPSPDGRWIAYSQEEPDGQRNPWLLDLENGPTPLLLSLSPLVAQDFSWSPGGDRLAFYDAQSGAIQVVDLQGQSQAHFDSRIGGAAAWQTDGKGFYFARETAGQGFASVGLFHADLETGAVRLVLEGETGGEDFGAPRLSPDGTRLLSGQRTLAGHPAKQLFLISIDGSEIEMITADVAFTHAAYQWSPGGEWVIYQRFAFGASANRPQVMVWKRASGETRVVVKDAALPQWLP